jgi:hypothetical protein
MDFLNHRERGMVFSGFPPFSYRNRKRLHGFEEIEISRQSCTLVRVTVNNKKEKSGFHPRIRPVFSNLVQFSLRRMI